MHEVVDDRGGAVSPSYTLGANTQEGMTVDAGKEINLEVGMGGSPAPTAKWTKDGVATSDRCVIESTELKR